ncbi:uncharacterized protein LOC127286942 [Leptopilina boulardi]|uniref:uncharacterized protein LOC127286942 n=1 Tax=Leptopilina boulardi TaxID=63433 RepID=UPI0021F53D2B|nr:uncharacterized protein LOC127286942 [Leptopilina boulardi]XP_051169569.1 uncharacterized protein LOC127286942 [Leptopilina boulardi]XP_051169570.1 uncharacterized protein LOC127286942 [Leptopilina boulardi]
MSKSRSGGSSSSSVESDDPHSLPNVSTDSDGFSELQSTGASSIVSQNSTIPYSPPPSYEHVLEETRLERSASTEDEDGENTVVQNGSSGIEEILDRGYSDEQQLHNHMILHNKSSKELYKAVAKQWGLTCKMSDHCRCFDCQSRYFDCDFEKDGYQGTDGGLGAGTPMFISEVMHGTACSLL